MRIATTYLGIFTYGSFPREVLQGQAISILDESLLFNTDSNGGVQVIDEDRRLFYIPSANLKSYYVSPHSRNIH